MYKSFPRIAYPYDTLGNTKSVTDILSNVKFTEYFNKNKAQLFSEYIIKDNDKPESIANKLYGDSKLYWVVLIFNDMFNPYFDWPLNRADLESVISSKYPGSCIYIDPTSDVLLDADGITKLSFSKHWFIPGTSVTYKSAEGVAQFTTTVLETNRTYNSITVSTVGSVELGGYLVGTNDSGVEFRMNVGRIVYDNTYALHHFEDANGTRIDPYESLIGSSIKNDATCALVRYISGDDLYSVPNREFEESNNDAKRKVYLVKPEYISVVVSTLSKMFQ